MHHHTNTEHAQSQDFSIISNAYPTFTLFTASTLLCKEFTLQNNEIVKRTNATMYAGRSDTVTLPLKALADYINAMPNNAALGLGVLVPEKHPTRHNIKTKSALTVAPDKTAHTRSKENYKFSNGAGLIMFDYDSKELLTLDEVHGALLELLPELTNIEMLGVSSSSAGIYATHAPHIKTTANGCHFYAVVNDARLIPAIGGLLRLRSWQQGKAGFRKGKKSFIENTVFDRCVFTAERLIFESPPIFGNGLSRHPRTMKMFNENGAMLDVAKAMPMLCRVELDAKTKLPKTLSDELNGLVKKARNDIKGVVTQELRAKGYTASAIAKIIHNLSSGQLTATDTLEGAVTGVNEVSHIIAEIKGGTDLGKQFLNDSFLDPNSNENEKDFSKAELYANPDGTIILNSFAHGGRVFFLTDTTTLDESPFLNNHTQGSETMQNFDDEIDFKKIDLLKHLPDTHILKRFTSLIHEQTFIPPSSLLMVGLSVVSGYTSTSTVVNYRDGKGLPIGLYVVAEQPSGTGKSNAMNSFLAPFTEKLQTAYRAASDAVKNVDLGKKSEDFIASSTIRDRIGAKFPTTNATSEALEKSLIQGDGFFFCASSEQGLFNSLLGLSYKTDGAASNNNDIVLNGYDASYTRSIRAGREGFVGRPVGAVSLFAQSGSIDKVIAASQGTGLSERFLCLAEPSALGTRNHLREYPVNAALVRDYTRKCEPFAADAASGEVINFSNLRQLQISANDWQLIGEFKNRLEPHLRGKYSHPTLVGAAAKCEQNIMKIASNLHLLGDNPHLNVIDSVHVVAAINITGDVLKGFYNICQVKGLCGQSVEYTAILNMAGFKDKKPAVSMLDIINNRRQVKPFSDIKQDKSKHIKDTVLKMVDDGLLVEVGKDHYRAV